jgi:hypothetical protein
MISQPVDEFLVYLVGVFAALLWLRPGRREAIRYAMILLSAGVLYALLMQEAAGWQYQVLLHVKHSVSLILFLLGVYMLNPMTPLIELFRSAYLGSTCYYLNYYWLSIAMTLLVFVLGVILFSRVEKTFMDTV